MMHDRLIIGRAIGMSECGKSNRFISRALHVGKTSVSLNFEGQVELLEGKVRDDHERHLKEVIIYYAG